MADQPIDTSDRPSMLSIRCAGEVCGKYIVVDEMFVARGRIGYCSGCLHARIGSVAGVVVVEPPPQWFSRNNPPPPPAVYPPGAPIAGIRVADPDVAGYCLAHDPPVSIHLMSLDPHDITLAYRMHDILAHHPTRWLIGGPGGADGDVCNPCGGARWDKDLGKVVRMEQPRHDLCLRGVTRGRGRDCPCRHDRPWMRGIKPQPLDPADQIAKAIERTPPPEPIVSEPPVIITNYLFDPEEEDPHA